jgi:uncharacterized protein YoxC
MIEIIGGGIIAVLSWALYSKKNNAEAKSSELQVMQDALNVFKNYTAELTQRVNELSEEVNNLRTINEHLQQEILNLQSLLNRRL